MRASMSLAMPREIAIPRYSKILVGLSDDSGDLVPMHVAEGKKQAIDVGSRGHFTPATRYFFFDLIS